MDDPSVPVRPLPGNPNCLAFAAPARHVLAGRSWARVVELAAEVLADFHAACGLAVVLGFSKRVALDRRNRRQQQVTMYLLLDGPAAPEHVDQLEQTVARDPLGWGQGTIERLPVDGVHCLYAGDGEVSLVVGGPTGAEEVAQLTWRDGAATPRSVSLAQADPALLDWPKVRLGPARYGPEERETERMRLAFAHDFAQRIVEADGVIHADEEAFMATVFHPDTLRRLGLDTDEARQTYLRLALRELPGRIGYHDKLALVGLFFTACYSDGNLDAREMRVLKDASEALGVDRERVVSYLQRFW